MQKLRSRYLVAAAVLACAGSQANAEAIFGLTLDNRLVVFDSATPGSTSAPIPVTRLATGQTLVGIDFRPLDRQLVGVAAGPARGARSIASIRSPVRRRRSTRFPL